MESRTGGPKSEKRFQVAILEPLFKISVSEEG